MCSEKHTVKNPVLLDQGKDMASTFSGTVWHVFSDIYLGNFQRPIRRSEGFNKTF